MNSGVLDQQQLSSSSTGLTIGRQLLFVDTTDSTNTRALSHVDDPTNHGLVIFAESQSAGRGRFNRRWHSPRGASIMCTALLFMIRASNEARTVLLWSALAVREAIRESTHLNADLKWPNDLLISDKKVCGILIESRHIASKRDAFLVGIGINCLQHKGHFPHSIGESVTSLELESNMPIDRTAVASELLKALDKWYVRAAAETPEAIAEMWLDNALPLGRRIRIQAQGREFIGSLIRLDPLEGILVQLDQGGRKMFDPGTSVVLRL